jgi:head-tail adaptor
MTVGELRDYVQILTETETFPGSDDGEGGHPVTWPATSGTYANFRPASGREQAIAGAVQTVAIEIVTVPYSVTLTEKNRLRRLADGVEFDIVTKPQDPDGRRVWRQMICSETI